MDNFDRDLEDLLNMTDSEDDTSSSSSNPYVFDNNQPLILELHELKKDEPGADTVASSQEAKRKKMEKRRRKKNKQEASKDGTSETSSGLSDSVPTIAAEVNKDEFYDAHESYHALPEPQQTSPNAALMLSQVHSQHANDPKVSSQAPSATQSATPREPSTINKPVCNPP